MAQKTAALRIGRILVVEDNEDVRFSIAQVLRVGGYDAVEAQDLDHAAVVIAQGDVALVLLDYGMPDGRGLRLLDGVVDELPPIILMSASGAMPVVDPRVLAFVSKPFQPGQLLEEVSRQLIRP